MCKKSNSGICLSQSTIPFFFVGPHKLFQLVLIVFVFLTAGMARAQDKHTNATGFVWRQCNEQVIMMRLAREHVRPLVDKRFKLNLNDDGTVGIIIVVQDCDPYYFNGKNVGPAHEIHVWAGIEGPRDNTKIPVVGAKDTLVTLSWYFLFSGSSNELARKLYNDNGVPSKPVEQLDILWNPEISGNMAVDSKTSLMWNASPNTPWAPSLGVNHDIFSTDNEGTIYYTQVQALLVVHSWGAPGKLEVKGNLGGNNVIPAGNYNIGVNTFDPIWVRISLNVPLPENASEVFQIDDE